jgi:hypothetical protein
MIGIGERVWFPSQWDTGVLDSILHDTHGQIIAYVIRLDDGKKFALDMQIVERLDD